MAIRDTIKSRLIGRAGISAQESCNTYLDSYLDEAVAEHDSSYAPAGVADYSLLPVSEYELVLLLAWVRVCEFRASNAAPQPSLRGVGAGFGSDRDTPFAKNMAMAKYLRQQYDNLKSTLESQESENGTGDITLGELYRKDDLIDAAVPLTVAPLLKAPTLSYASVVDVQTGGADLGSVIVSWTAVLSEYFSELFLFKSSTAGIVQMWNETPASGIPFVSADASQIYATTDNFSKAVKNTSLAAGTYYYVMAMRDTNGRYSFSNEIAVTIPATPTTTTAAPTTTPAP